MTSVPLGREDGVAVCASFVAFASAWLSYNTLTVFFFFLSVLVHIGVDSLLAIASRLYESTCIILGFVEENAKPRHQGCKECCGLITENSMWHPFLLIAKVSLVGVLFTWPRLLDRGRAAWVLLCTVEQTLTRGGNGCGYVQLLAYEETDMI